MIPILSFTREGGCSFMLVVKLVVLQLWTFRDRVSSPYEYTIVMTRRAM